MADGVGLQAAFEEVDGALRSTGLEYAYIGALAAIAWGRSRTTTDLDLVVACSPQQFGILDAALRAAGLQPGSPVGPAEPGDPLPDIAVYWTGAEPAVRVDVFLAKTDFESAVLATRKRASMLGLAVPIASPEAVIVYKVLANRGKDVSDIEGLLAARAASGEPLDWQFIEKWAAEWRISERIEPLRARSQAEYELTRSAGEPHRRG